MPERARVAIAAASFAVLATLPAAQAPPGLSKNDRDAAISMLRQVREDLERNYYDPAFRGIDVRARFAEAESRLNSVASINDAIGILTDSLMQLNDSHTAFFPPNRATQADYGWEMASVGKDVRVVSVTPGSDAAAQGIQRGDLVVSLNRFLPSRENLWQITHLYHFVRPQAQQHVVVRKPDGTERALDVRSKVTTKRVTELSDLFDEMARAMLRHLDVQTMFENVYIWKMNQFGSKDAIQQAMRQARKAAALVLDLRGNGGGAAETLIELTSRTFKNDVEVATEISRKGQRVVRARPKDAFDGTLVVLVDSHSASAAEMFARLVQLEKRGTVIGDRTAGMVMLSDFFPHTIGLAAVAFYATSITVADVRMSDGGRLENVGVNPDEIVLPTPDDLAHDRDPVLARALALTGHEVTSEAARKLIDRS